jgi:hypothetical protein
LDEQGRFEVVKKLESMALAGRVSRRGGAPEAEGGLGTAKKDPLVGSALILASTLFDIRCSTF